MALSIEISTDMFASQRNFSTSFVFHNLDFETLFQSPATQVLSPGFMNMWEDSQPLANDTACIEDSCPSSQSSPLDVDLELFEMSSCMLCNLVTCDEADASSLHMVNVSQAVDSANVYDLLVKRRREEEEAAPSQPSTMTLSCFEWEDPEEEATGRNKRARVTASRNRRGEHVRNRPDMQEKARMGQVHWASKNKETKQAWSVLGLGADPLFSQQVQMMEQKRTKSQLACLLRTLHIACKLGIIEYHSGENRAESFHGCTSFRVVPEQHVEFRRLVEALLPAGFPKNTLHNMFRRSGLVPTCWGEAWMGNTPFTFKTH